MYTEQLTQGLALADVVNSQAVNNTSVQSAGINLNACKRVLYVVFLESVGGANCTLTGNLQSSATANFATAHNISGSNLATMNTNNTIATIEVRADEVQQANPGDQYVRLNLTTAGNTAATVLALGLAAEGEHKPVDLILNLNSNIVNQQVVV